MIAGFFHQGSGIGNQIFRYITVRTLAEKKGWQWGFDYVPDGSGKPEGFKGDAFMQIEKGVFIEGITKEWTEKKIVENGIDVRGYDPEINFVQDNTMIDGEFQDERYWGHNMENIARWLKTEPLDVPDDLCVIGFRGGEYTLYPDLFLPESYWHQGMEMMRTINLDMKFHVVTDDPATAQRFFACPITHEIGHDWRMVRNAKYAIIANSSFYIIPRLLQHHENDDWAHKTNSVTIAPRYWARHNLQTWALPQNFYSSFFYI